LAGGIEFIDVIPKNPSGKLLRRLLRDKAKEARKRILEEANTVKTRL
jgi:acyl-coenzyme A synthetase/AMP-(fatty) acid ligase